LLNKKMLDGNVETMILAVLNDGSNYGYQLVQELNAKSPELLQFGEGTIYPVLHRMEKRGVISAFWQEGETGRKRKYYRLTTRGKRQLEENLSQWQSLVEVMTGFMEDLPDHLKEKRTRKIKGEPA